MQQANVFGAITVSDSPKDDCEDMHENLKLKKKTEFNILLGHDYHKKVLEKNVSNYCKIPMES